MKLKPRWVPFLVLASFLTARAAYAEDPPAETTDNNFDYSTVTTSEGLTFRVPEDMPIETRGGIQAPIPFDEYMYGKFRKFEDRLKVIDTKLDRIEKLLLEMRDEKARLKAMAS